MMTYSRDLLQRGTDPLYRVAVRHGRPIINRPQECQDRTPWDDLAGRLKEGKTIALRIPASDVPVYLGREELYPVASEDYPDALVALYDQGRALHVRLIQESSGCAQDVGKSPDGVGPAGVQVLQVRQILTVPRYEGQRPLRQKGTLIEVDITPTQRPPWPRPWLPKTDLD